VKSGDENASADMLLMRSGDEYFCNQVIQRWWKKRYKILWRWFINTIIVFLGIVLFLFKNNVSETGFCLLPQVKADTVGPNR
jgi:hypothetical protein